MEGNRPKNIVRACLLACSWSWREISTGFLARLRVAGTGLDECVGIMGFEVQRKGFGRYCAGRGALGVCGCSGGGGPNE